jgi:hypothetical protein
MTNAGQRSERRCLDHRCGHGSNPVSSKQVLVGALPTAAWIL